MALDITSISSYSSLIRDCERGYNRGGEDLAQINVCLLFGQKPGLPVYQTVYSGSLKNVSTFSSVCWVETGGSWRKDRAGQVF
jgi:transposase